MFQFRKAHSLETVVSGVGIDKNLGGDGLSVAAMRQAKLLLIFYYAE